MLTWIKPNKCIFFKPQMINSHFDFLNKSLLWDYVDKHGKIEVQPSDVSGCHDNLRCLLLSSFDEPVTRLDTSPVAHVRLRRVNCTFWRKYLRTFTFTFSNLADTFIQSDKWGQWMQSKSTKKQWYASAITSLNMMKRTLSYRQQLIYFLRKSKSVEFAHRTLIWAYVTSGQC